MWNEMRKGTPARLPGYLEDVREAAVVPIILLLTADRADVLRFISLSDGFYWMAECLTVAVRRGHRAIYGGLCHVRDMYFS